MGQDGVGSSEASQSPSSSQEANQNTMCVSEEIASLSCNNLSTGDIRGVQDDKNSMLGMIYVIQGSSGTGTREASSTASCNSGDYIISGFFSVSTDTASLTFKSILENLDPENNNYTIKVSSNPEESLIVIAYAVCFDNPLYFLFFNSDCQKQII